MKHAEVWLVDFAPKVGQEIDKVRPAVIVNHDSMWALQLKVVVPITDAVRSIRDWQKVLRIAFSLNQFQKKDLLNTLVPCQQRKWKR
jgi:mRNA-degrading endonuclease toxin of MazEF toxin-antitoxin module